MKKNLLVTMADENYVEIAKQLFSSAYFNGGWKGDYLLLAHEIPEEKLKWFRKKGILVKECKSLNSEDMRFSKLYLFTPEFKKWKNIVFLDSDIIVTASIQDLAEVNGFYAVHDLFPTINAQFPFKSRNKNVYREFKRKYNLKEDIFNGGVMAFSTNLIEKDSFNRLKELTKKYLIFSQPGEQGAINLLFYKKWEKLPPAYNFNPFLMVHPFLTKKNPGIKGIILHFPGSRKPWNEKYSYYYRLWEKNLDKADSINIKNPINPKIKYSEEEIKIISKKIERKLFFHSPINCLDKLVGLIGIYLKKKTPGVYQNLKNFQLNFFKIKEE